MEISMVHHLWFQAFTLKKLRLKLDIGDIRYFMMLLS